MNHMSAFQAVFVGRRRFMTGLARCRIGCEYAAVLSRVTIPTAHGFLTLQELTASRHGSIPAFMTRTSGKLLHFMTIETPLIAGQGSDGFGFSVSGGMTGETIAHYHLEMRPVYTGCFFFAARFTTVTRGAGQL